MRRVLAFVALLLALAPDTARAGCSCDAYVLLPHVAYQAGAFQSCLLDVPRLMRERGVALLIEEHVAGLVQRGELPPGSLHVRGANAYAGQAPPVSVSRNEGGWFIEGAPALDLRNLIRTIDYFASPSWRPFEDTAAPGGAEDPRVIALRRFERVLDRAVPEPDMAEIRARRITVFEAGDLAAIYVNDAVHYEIAGRRLATEPRGFLPGQVGQRWILQSGDSIVALDTRGDVVASLPVPAEEDNRGCHPHALFAKAHPKWVNLTNACGTVLMTYSLEKDAFFPVEVKTFGADPPDLRERLGIHVTDCG